MKKTIADYPELLKEWHPTLNGDLMPCDVSCGSEKKIWWICERKHEWQTGCVNKMGCPYCANRKACKDNCLAITHPELLKEWHSTLNGNLTPSDVVAGTHKKIWWKCEKRGHDWQAVCYNRTSKGKNGCPYCANQKVCKDNCLAVVDPELAKEWHPTKNGNITPNDIIMGARKRYWWRCFKGHEWEISCDARTGKRKSGCPYCANKKICKDNCLATTHPELAKEWHPTKNGNLTPNDISYGSEKKYYWTCDKNHEWTTTCNSRTFGKHGCPYCTNQKVCKDNCLATVNPELSKEWHPTLNGTITPNDIIAGTAKKYWWICDKKHEWKSSCDSRMTSKTGCPICSESKGEKEVARVLDELNVKYIREHTFEGCKHIHKLRFDFAVCIGDSFKIIEYHGIQHYIPISFGGSKLDKHESFKGIRKRDKIKKKFCKVEGMPFLEISYKEYDKIGEKVKKFLLV